MSERGKAAARGSAVPKAPTRRYRRIKHRRRQGRFQLNRKSIQSFRSMKRIMSAADMCPSEAIQRLARYRHKEVELIKVTAAQSLSTTSKKGARSATISQTRSLWCYATDAMMPTISSACCHPLTKSPLPSGSAISAGMICPLRTRTVELPTTRTASSVGGLWPKISYNSTRTWRQVE